ncbi:hypothetical protein ANCDUO_23589 [Ancylostoma duodenale]|uniref:Uncharacterized protein n=1 Tax=Ancylostoma duodenale TaxID=51022 RepID=A0A0C2FCX1_9BILA|nr:hypothetical protein ANCDUO_23589 [Ancylostoma duodenale]
MSPSLYEKVEKFYAMMMRKVNSLGPEAQAFAVEMMNTARNFRVQYLSGRRPSRAELKQAALYVINKYRAMSASGKIHIHECKL